MKNRLTEQGKITRGTFVGEWLKDIKEMQGALGLSHAQQVYLKLKEIEDIEEELGIDLITYFKLKQGTKVYTNSPYLKEECVIECVFGVGKDTTYHICPSMYEKSGGYIGINEYGTTFALTKEELL